MKSTDVDVGEVAYLVKRVRGVERNEERTKWPREGQTISTGKINAEIRHAAVSNRGLVGGQARKAKEAG